MIFISYRRLDNQFLAAGVHDAIVEHLALVGQVFFDVSSIEPGVDFVAATRQSIEQAAVVLVLVGPDWRPDRLFDRDDFVRLELLTAIELGKHIVPVLHTGRKMPKAKDLPPELRWLTTLNAFELDAPPDHRRSLRMLAELVRRKLPVTAGSRAGGVGSQRHGSLDDLIGSGAISNFFNNPFGRKDLR